MQLFTSNMKQAGIDLVSFIFHFGTKCKMKQFEKFRDRSTFFRIVKENKYCLQFHIIFEKDRISNLFQKIDF